MTPVWYLTTHSITWVTTIRTELCIWRHVRRLVYRHAISLVCDYNSLLGIQGVVTHQAPGALIYIASSHLIIATFVNTAHCHTLHIRQLHNRNLTITQHITRIMRYIKKYLASFISRDSRDASSRNMASKEEVWFRFCSNLFIMISWTIGRLYLSVSTK